MSLPADRQTELHAPLADVSELSIQEILHEHTALAGALKRLEAETRSRDDLYAGFGNFAPDEEPEPTAVAAQHRG